MKVRLILESSGFGYSNGAINWMVEDPDNLGVMEKLSKHMTVDIPARIVPSIHNLINVETGEFPSQIYDLHTDKEVIKAKYVVPIDPIKQEIKQTFSNGAKLKQKLKLDDSK
jgi:hypothetical protein